MATWADALQGVFGPVVGAAITLWATRKAEGERISAAIIWSWAYDRSGAQIEEPFLHVQNRSGQPILISRVRWQKGLMRRSAGDEIPLNFEDPTDIDFPYEIKAGEVRRFELDNLSARRMVQTASPLERTVSRISRRPYLWIEIGTVTGTRVRIGASDATPWRDRPAWLAASVR